MIVKYICIAFFSMQVIKVRIIFAHTNAHNYNVCWKDFSVCQKNFLYLNNCASCLHYHAVKHCMSHSCYYYAFSYHSIFTLNFSHTITHVKLYISFFQHLLNTDLFLQQVYSNKPTIRKIHQCLLVLTCIVIFPISGPSDDWKGNLLLPITVTLDALSDK